MKISNYFLLEEVICPEIYNECKEISTSFISERLIAGLDKLRAMLNKPITINDWFKGGNFKYSGLRPHDCKEGAKWSDHKFGHAVDIRIPNMHSFEVQNFIKYNWLQLNQFFTALEKDTDGWTHISDRFIPNQNKAFPFLIPIK